MATDRQWQAVADVRRQEEVAEKVLLGVAVRLNALREEEEAAYLSWKALTDRRHTMERALS